MVPLLIDEINIHMNTTLITQDGTYPIKRTLWGGKASKLIVLASGAYGTATLALHILNGAGNWVPLDGGEITLNTQRVLHQGTKLKFAVECTGADGDTDIVFDTEETA